MKSFSSRSGFSLIEAVLAIVLLGASFLGLSLLLSNTTVHNIDLDISNTAILLARDTMVETKAQKFDDIDDVSITAFGGDFSDYSYQVDVDYVDPTNLDAPVAGPTAYKRIIVTVTMSDWSGDVKLYGLKTNAEDY